MNILNKEQAKYRLVSIALIITMIFSLLAMFKTTNTVHAEGPYSDSKTVLMDLDGKGAKESVTFQPAEYDSDMFYKRLDVYINGKKKLSLPYSTGYAASYYEYKRIKLANGKVFLYIELTNSYGKGPHRLYQYTSGKLKCKLKFQDLWFRWIGEIKAKSNSIVTTVGSGEMIPGLATTWYSATYVYEGGKFKRKNKAHNIICYLKNGKFRKPSAEKVTYSFVIYKDKSCKKKLKKVPVGVKVKPTKIYIGGIASVYVKSKKYSGWYFAYDPKANPCGGFYFAGLECIT